LQKEIDELRGILSKEVREKNKTEARHSVEMEELRAKVCSLWWKGRRFLKLISEF